VIRTHQNIILNGVDCGEVKSRRGSMFYNEGKWDTFIAPFLPDDCSDLTFLEIGCNAGIMLNKAKERGFQKVIGIERNENAIGMGERVRARDYKFINAEVDKNFDIDSLPMVDYLLLSNVHYYIHMPVFLKFVNLLRRKARYVIVVSDSRRRITFHFPQPDYEVTRKYFRHFKEVKIIKDVDYGDDHRPRPQMFSILFKTELERVPIDTIIKSFDKAGTIHFNKAYQLIDFQDISLLCEKDKNSFDVMKDVLVNGVKQPIILLPNNRIVDGSHRVAMLKRLEHKSVIAEYCE